ncbi:MAG: metallophosphoesterase family protein [Gaiella sp.]
MRVAALYDVHGNVAALAAVLADPRCEAADLIVSGGDLVAGPFPEACLDRLRGLGERVVYVRGNGDRAAVERRVAHGAAWCAQRLGDERLAFVATWPLTVSLPVAGGALFCHATPRADDEIVTALTPTGELVEAIGVATEPLVVAGHTHMQLERHDLAGRRFVVAGSVGRPYEGTPGAFWALVDDDGVELLRTDYDVEAASATIRASGYPDALEHARLLLEPEDPAEVARHFEGLRGS